MKDISWCLLGVCVHLECVGDCIDLQENIHACTRSCGVQRSMSNVILNHSPPFLFFLFFEAGLSLGLVFTDLTEVAI